MNNRSVDKSDAVYIAWSEDRQTAAPQKLGEWIAANPAHSAELIQWAADEAVAESAAVYSASPTAEARAIEIGRQAAARMRAQTAAPVRSLLTLAQQQNLDTDALAERLSLSEPLIMKLERRLLRVATVPAQLIQSVAETLRVTAQQIQAYLALPAALANKVSYRSETVPQAMQQDFAQAVRNDYELTDDQKQFWLSTIPDGKNVND